MIIRNGPGRFVPSHVSANDLFSAAWGVHGYRSVTFLERRKGSGTASIDRRKSYVDVIERVLGNQVPTSAVTKSRRFVWNTSSVRPGVSTVSEVQVSIFDSIEDARNHKH
jgi:hypothetical protein